MTNILILYYSAYGHIFKMVEKVEKNLKDNKNVKVKLTRVPEFEASRKNMSTQEAYVEAQKSQQDIPVAELDDLKWADGIVWGIPTRFGNMPAQIKQFIDRAGGLWMEGALEDTVTGVITSSNTMHGGQETTIISSLIPMLHLGMIPIGLPYGQNPELNSGKGIGGTPYGPSTVAGPDGSRTPVEDELNMAVRLGKRVARVAIALNR